MADIANIYLADKGRYSGMAYNRVGRSGLKFPAVSLGFWHNFGSNGNYDNMRRCAARPLTTASHSSIWRTTTVPSTAAQRPTRDGFCGRISGPTGMS